MKKFILILITIITICINANADSGAKCLLQHKGSVQFFDGDKIAAAIKAATDGDTLFLSEGLYPGFTINKKITVRGAGQESKIAGEVKINISNNPTLTQTILEWVNLVESNNITIETPMKKLKIKQCTFYTLNANASNIENALIDRCHINGSIDGFKSVNIVNSKIYIAGYVNSGQEYLNCNIMGIRDNYVGKYTNCIIQSCYTSSYRYEPIINSFFKNCLFMDNDFSDLSSSSSAINCWYDTSLKITSNTFNCSLGKYELEENGYIGTDGTVVGIEGGSAPFTLEPSVPKVTNSTVAYDAANKLLKVNLTVTTNNEQ